ncbi:putative methyltransferase [Nonomuraea polychroma]|uniref:Putative methyltransferase n=1 Tax=Nonomuraea polychroma TaxID=46176 RepID=A0A438MP66_9ACTN|nr:class I SAM-dependent methyltransferase family protein [Nonomuraea polychroma]RVX47590.1 putative methyltransferase [Nonomuraea polychroma]
MDWQEWHDEYDRPESRLSQRLRVVQSRIRQALDAAAPGPVRVISICAGQGRDLLPVLAEHPRRGDVRARLVELDPGNTEAARSAAEAAGLDQVDVVTGDATLTDQYQGMAPADIVMLCGIFGNISDDDIKRAVGFSPHLCAGGGTVIWTRHRRAPDLVPVICGWFEELGFEREWVSDPEAGFGVGVHRFPGPPQPLAVGERMFSFANR